MKFRNFIKILLAFFIIFAPSNGIAKTIKWSMQGDSLTLDPHAQNEGPTTQVSRQIYEALVTSCLLYTSPSPRDKRQSRMPSSA